MISDSHFGARCTKGSYKVNTPPLSDWLKSFKTWIEKTQIISQHPPTLIISQISIRVMYA